MILVAGIASMLVIDGFIVYGIWAAIYLSRSITLWNFEARKTRQRQRGVGLNISGK